MFPNKRHHSRLPLCGMLAGVCSLLAFALPCRVSADPGSLCIAFWNVENLFDTIDDPEVSGDEEYTPFGKRQWTWSRLDAKILDIATVIDRLNEDEGPDLIGLSEVENLGVLERLAARTKRRYAIVHKDSPSRRGIDCAILYDPGVFQLRDQRYHVVKPTGNYKTRDVVEAEFEIGGSRLIVFVNHWPSRSGGEKRTAPFRLAAARVVRDRVTERLREQPNAELVVMGDLNDYPSDESVCKTLRAVADAGTMKPGDLFNTTARFEGTQKGTHLYRGRWNVLDHMIVSQGLLDSTGLSWKRGSTKICEEEAPLHMNPWNEMGPYRTFAGKWYHGGYSDHLPIACVLTTHSTAGGRSVSPPARGGAKGRR